MPLYEYKCQSCGKTFEVIQKFADEPLKTHPECGGVVEKLFSAPAFYLKGTGWYATDYGKGNGKNTKSDEQKADAKSEGAEKAAQTESKPESKTESKEKSPSTPPATESKPAATESKPSPVT
jgi:putative FmdB family regulatory protein